MRTRRTKALAIYTRFSARCDKGITPLRFKRLQRIMWVAYGYR